MESSGIISPKNGVKGLINGLLAKNIAKVLSIPGKKLERRYHAASMDVESAQLGVMREILGYARDTTFGQEHEFAGILSYDDYRRNVPVRDYEGHRPYVERHAKGEQNVLFPGKPLMYTRTSGTTAAAKLIPITPYNFEKTIKNRGKLWLYSLSKSFDGIFEGKDFTLVSPAIDGHTEDGVPYGALSGLIYQHIPDFVKLLHTIPYEVVTIKDFESRAYALVRFGVPANVSSVYTGNPATVLNLAKRADEWKERIIRDVRDGTIGAQCEMDPKTRRICEASLEPAPARAAELEKIATANERFLPTDYWPNLKLVHTWTNGNCALVVPKLRQWYGDDVPILDFGYIASEITATDIIDPRTNGSHLAILSGFYEFTPYEEGSEPETFLMAHQLEVGKRYFIYITTYSGLYRYNMNDVIEVLGHFNQNPIFRFRYKGHGVTSLQGEKLSETQFIEGMAKASEITGVRYEFFVGYADSETDRYAVYAEIVGDQTRERLDAFMGELDQALMDSNIEYESKRKSARLHAPVLIELTENAFRKFRALRLEEGAFEGQLKWIHLAADDTVKNRMVKLVKR